MTTRRAGGGQARRPMPMSTRRLVARLGVVLLGSAATLVVATGPAAAHNVLLSTDPASGTTVERVPAAVVLTFDNPAIAMGTQLVITGPSGQVQQGAARLVDNTVSQDLQGGAPAGTYTVQWRVTSIDGHPVGGTFTFTARSAGAGTSDSAPSPLPAGSADAARPRMSGWLGGAVALLVVGLGSVGVILVRRRRRTGPEDADRFGTRSRQDGERR